MFQNNETKTRIWNLLWCFCLSKNTNINKQIYKNMFQINERKIEWILLIKHTNINKQIYNNMFQINDTKK